MESSRPPTRLHIATSAVFSSPVAPGSEDDTTVRISASMSPRERALQTLMSTVPPDESLVRSRQSRDSHGSGSDLEIGQIKMAQYQFIFAVCRVRPHLQVGPPAKKSSMARKRRRAEACHQPGHGTHYVLVVGGSYRNRIRGVFRCLHGRASDGAQGWRSHGFSDFFTQGQSLARCRPVVSTVAGRPSYDMEHRAPPTVQGSRPNDTTQHNSQQCFCARSECLGCAKWQFRDSATAPRSRSGVAGS